MENKKFLTVPYSRELQAKYAGSFDCGNDLISSILKTEDAFRDMVGKTYVMLDEGKGRIIGYYNISTGDITDDRFVRLEMTAFRCTCRSIMSKHENMYPTPHSAVGNKRRKTLWES